jgi:hypothetical protein
MFLYHAVINPSKCQFINDFVLTNCRLQIATEGVYCLLTQASVECVLPNRTVAQKTLTVQLVLLVRAVSALFQHLLLRLQLPQLLE